MESERKKGEPLVSIVTPFYNVAEYLPCCIESVLNQTYENWEYVLVNNCSYDGSGRIAEEYAKKDKRIRLIKNDTFLKQVPNYNHALSLISHASEYVKVVQADDWIFPECISEMIRLAEQFPKAAIVSSYRLEGERVTCDGLKYPSFINSGRLIGKLALISGLNVFGSPTTLLYRSNLVRSRTPFYNIDSLNEDTEVCFELLKNNDFGFVHKVLTFTRRDNVSISSSRATMGTDLLGKLSLLQKFGNVFLSDNELNSAIRSQKAKYYRFLARNTLILSDANFWKYHRVNLKRLGLSLSMHRMLYALICEVGEGMSNPSLTLHKMCKYFQIKRTY